MNFNLNLNRLICNCTNNNTITNNNVDELVISFEKIAELNQGIVAYELYLGKILQFLNGEYGFINKSKSNGIIVYQNLSIHGISINDRMMMSNFHNIPLFYGNQFVGAMGFGGPHLKMKYVKLIKPLFDIIAKELYLYKI